MTKMMHMVCFEIYTSANNASDEELGFGDFTFLKEEELDYKCYFVCATVVYSYHKLVYSSICNQSLRY